MKHALWILALAACVTESTEPAPTAPVTQEAGRRCEPWGCGENSAQVGDGMIFDALDATGDEPNIGGVRIAKVIGPDLDSGTIRVERHELVVETHGRTWRGQDLVGTVIRLVGPNGEYELQIQGVDMQALTFWRGDDERVPAYDIKARIADKDVKFDELICKGDIIAEDPRWERAAHAAIVFAGDRYDAQNHRVYDEDRGPGWFNLACAATAPAKMHLQRHTNAGARNAAGELLYKTSLTQRTTLLRMFTADYCGDGTSYTVNGTPLNYQSSASSYPIWPYSGGLWGSPEAIWNKTGAVCLDTPRIWTISRNDVTCADRLPTCGGLAGWEAHGYLATSR